MSVNRSPRMSVQADSDSAFLSAATRAGVSAPERRNSNEQSRRPWAARTLTRSPRLLDDCDRWIPYSRVVVEHPQVLHLRHAFDRAIRGVPSRWPAHQSLVAYALEGGHRTRPIGCLLACEAVGGDWRDAMSLAVAVELAHKASVLRDDLVDGDTHRGQRKTFAARYGTSLTVAVSDLLWGASLADVAGEASPPGTRDQCLTLFNLTNYEMVAGQLHDVRNTNPAISRGTRQDLLLTASMKTGALTELAVVAGAIAGRADDEQIAALRSFGRNLGTAFQLLNDAYNLLGTDTVRGHQLPFSDARRRKRTSLVNFALSVVSESDKRELAEYVTTPGPADDADVVRFRELLLAAGAERFAIETAHQLLEDGRRCLEVLPRSQSRLLLESATDSRHFADRFF